MSVEAMSWVFKHSPYYGRERLVHLAIADVVNDVHDNQMWLPYQVLAQKAGCSVDTVSRSVAKMRADGYLDCVEMSGGRGRPGVYRFIMKTPQGAALFLKTPQNVGKNPAKPTSSPLVNSNEPKGEKPRVFDVPRSEELPARIADIRTKLKQPTRKEAP